MGEQLELFSFDELLSNSSPSPKPTSLRDWELEDNYSSIPNPTPKKVFDNKSRLSDKAVSEYQPGGSAGGESHYFRFSYREGNRVKHIHIKGGNTTNPVAIERAEAIRLLIEADIPVERILKRLKSW